MVVGQVLGVHHSELFHRIAASHHRCCVPLLAHAVVSSANADDPVRSTNCVAARARFYACMGEFVIRVSLPPSLPHYLAHVASTFCESVGNRSLENDDGER